MVFMSTENQALEAAIDQAGGITKMAAALGLSSHNVVAQWRRSGVPAKHAPDIEALTGIPCEQLCPGVNWGVLRYPAVPGQSNAMQEGA